MLVKKHFHFSKAKKSKKKLVITLQQYYYRSAHGHKRHQNV